MSQKVSPFWNFPEFEYIDKWHARRASNNGDVSEMEIDE